MANEMTQHIKPQEEIILYQPDETTRLDVLMENETVWLNRLQLAELFGRDVKTIGKHVNNALREELKNVPVIANFATTASDGKTYQDMNRLVKFIVDCLQFREMLRRGRGVRMLLVAAKVSVRDIRGI